MSGSASRVLEPRCALHSGRQRMLEALVQGIKTYLERMRGLPEHSDSVYVRVFVH